jgi:O-antigen/teichoic acid export membrane protein
MALVVMAAAIVATLAINMIVDAVFLSLRQVYPLVVKNAVGGVIKVAIVVAFPSHGVIGLVLAHLLGVVASALVACVWLVRAMPGNWLPSRRGLDGIWSFSAANYLGVIAGILPASATPVIVHDTLGAGRSAVFYVCLMILSLVNMVPQTISLSLFAELSNAPAEGRRRLVSALMGLYGLQVPFVALVMLVSGLLLSIFGASYADDGGACLRWLVAGSLISGVAYLVDALVNGRGDGWGYLFLNVLNAVLVLIGVSVGARVSLTGVGIGWVVAQAISAVVCVTYAGLRGHSRDGARVQVTS